MLIKTRLEQDIAAQIKAFMLKVSKKTPKTAEVGITEFADNLAKVLFDAFIFAEKDIYNTIDNSGIITTSGGTIIRNGAGIPSNLLGNDGDYYINTSNFDFYFKVSGAYTLIGNLKGPAGTNGTNGVDGADGADGTDGIDGIDGNVWRNGSGVPANSLGIDDDYYLNDDNSDYYKKITGSYVLQGNLSGFATEVFTASISTTTNNYVITGASTKASVTTILRVTPTVSCKITGIDCTGWENGKRLVIENVTDPLGSGARIMILERESASSSAANRFNYPSMNMPIIIMPGEKVTLEYSTASSRLELVNNMNPSGYFNQYSDCYVTQPFIAQTGGAGSTLAASTFLVNDTTYKSQGVLICTTGTTTIGRSYVSTAVNSLMLGYGSILTLSRSGIDTLSTGTEEYTWLSGICDNTTNVVPVDSVAWQYDRTQSTDFTTITTSNSSPTRNTITGFTPTVNTLVYLGTFVNGDATNAEFFYSTDGEVWNFTANPHTTTIPSGTVRVSGFQVGITKSAGTGSRAVYVDSFGFKITGKRGV